MTQRRLVGAWAVALGVALGVGAAFGAGACARMPGPDAYIVTDQRKQEIAMLWGQIREWRMEAGLRGVEPPRARILAMRGRTVSSAKHVCRADAKPKTAECTDLCSLSNAICENAESICRIAKQLPGDSWAEDKCSSATASCEQAKRRCCKCVDGEPSDEQSE